MASVPKQWISPEEYLEQEREAEFKSEYYDGEVFAMAGATLRHGLIITNLLSGVRPQLEGRPCAVIANDLRVSNSKSDMYSYPDIAITCEPEALQNQQSDILLYPTVLIEVLSKSTKNFDRGEKFTRYRTIASLREYVTVAQEKMQVEQFVRQPNGQWLLTEYLDDGNLTMRFPSIDAELPLSAIYQGIQF